MDDQSLNKSKAGRKTKYRPEYDEQAYKLALLGATDIELADFFHVDEATLNRWKLRHKEFCVSIKKGKQIADGAIAEKLFQRASGYEHPHQEIMLHQKTGDPVVVDTIKHYPPDTTAIIFWLKNRQPEKWRDKQNVEVAGKIDLSSMTDHELDLLISKIFKANEQK